MNTRKTTRVVIDVLVSPFSPRAAGRSVPVLVLKSFRNFNARFIALLSGSAIPCWGPQRRRTMKQHSAARLESPVALRSADRRDEIEET